MDNLEAEKFMGSVLGIDVYYPFKNQAIENIALKKQERMLEISNNHPLYYLSATQQIDREIDQDLAEWGDERFIFLGMLTQKSTALKNQLEIAAAESLKHAFPDGFETNSTKSSEQVTDNKEDDMGTLFGIPISKPFKRNEIRELVKKKHELMVKAEKDGKTLYEASLDLQDQLNAFVENWKLNDQTHFLNMTAEETEALTRKINDQTTKVLVDDANTAIQVQWVISAVLIIIILLFVFSR